jgi:hypothetical protein
MALVCELSHLYVQVYTLNNYFCLLSVFIVVFKRSKGVRNKLEYKICLSRYFSVKHLPENP